MSILTKDINNYVYKLINEMLVKLFEPEFRRLQKVTDDLHKRNLQLNQPRQADYSVYEDLIFKPTGCPTGRLTKMSLHHSLIEDAQKFAADHKQIKEDMTLIKQGLFPVLEPCRYMVNPLQAMRDALPDALAELLPELALLPRINNVGHSLSPWNDPDMTKTKQFQEIIPRIEFYNAVRYLY